jgi:hypothetical protein
MRYVPKTVPLNTPSGLRDWLASELNRIANALRGVDNLELTPLAAQPARIRDGMIVYADGTNWNPGSGAGVYAREAGAWVKL